MTNTQNYTLGKKEKRAKVRGDSPWRLVKAH